MKNKKSTILALALSISFVVSAQTAFAEEANTEETNPTEAIETLKEEEKEEETEETEEENLETEEEAKPLEEDEEADDNGGLEISDLEEKEALGSPESDAFEQAADSMFDGISKKEGVYNAVYDKYGKNVTVTILDETQDAKEISGTGLVAGLTKLYNENNLVKIKVGGEDERDLKALAAAAPSSGMTVEQMFKLVFGADIVNAAQGTGKKTGKLKDFVGKTVNLVLTVKNGDGTEETLVYTINGVNKNGEIPEEKPEEKPENNENGYKTKEAAEKAAQEALKNDPVNKSYTISQNADGRYIYLLSSYEKIDTPEEDPEDPQTDEKPENNENGYKTKDAAIKAGEEAMPKNMKNNFKVTADQGANGRWFYRFEAKEDEKPNPNPDKPNPDKPVVPDHPSNPVVPGTTSDSDDETEVGTDDKVEEENKDENKAKDLIEKITENTKEIEKILKENEANQEGNDKKEDPTKDPEKETDKEKDNKNEEKQAPAKKHSNPKTGVVSMAPIVASFAISMSSLVALRKKND
ncbi:DUF5633 domain-containing protein [Anaerococcus sp. Marseille-P9784]|uniref:DUF5633 domain-containing protein n=1 Tax=Anaerococcus sp. Marseille-P9784 TaxID=2614127 RepID=UPI001788C9F7|nr:DUF5633 domain-containing protein [Anaerococcus sp. Marseille-P9784]